MFLIKYCNKCLFECFFLRIDSQHLLLILIQALPIFVISYCRISVTVALCMKRLFQQEKLVKAAI